MLVVQLAVLFQPHILLLGLGVLQKPGQILEGFLNIDIFLCADVVDLPDVVVLGELVHAFLFDLPLGRVYLVAEDEDVAVRAIVVLQLLVPVGAEVLCGGMDTS